MGLRRRRRVNGAMALGAAAGHARGVRQRRSSPSSGACPAVTAGASGRAGHGRRLDSAASDCVGRSDRPGHLDRGRGDGCGQRECRRRDRIQLQLGPRIGARRTERRHWPAAASRDQRRRRLLRVGALRDCRQPRVGGEARAVAAVQAEGAGSSTSRWTRGSAVGRRRPVTARQNRRFHCRGVPTPMATRFCAT